MDDAESERSFEGQIEGVVDDSSGGFGARRPEAHGGEGNPRIGGLDKKDKVVGIFSERDYARKISIKGKSLDTRVKEVMTPFDKMFTIKPDTPVEDCMVLMTGKHIRHLPVFDGPKFVGLISIGDAVKAQIAQKDALIDQLSNYIGGRY